MVTAGMTPHMAQTEIAARLQAAGCEDAAYDAALLYTMATGKNVRLSDAALTTEQAARLETLCRARAARVPLQYLAGEWGFFDFMLKVGPGVLCPRADTEVVAQTAIDELRKMQAGSPKVLDLCAGTGALGLAVRRFVPGAQVICVEKSAQALPYLRSNSAALESFGIPSPAVQAVQGDLFTFYQTLPEAGLEMILCNPPYLTAGEMENLQPEVAQEPAMALDGGEDGLVFYRALAEQYKEKLVPGGILVLEIGWRQKESVSALLAENGWDEIRCVRDFGGNDRCIVARTK